MLSKVIESRGYDHNGNVTGTSESCSWDAEEKACSIAPNSLGGGCMNENAIHGAPKKRREWRIALEGPH